MPALGDEIVAFRAFAEKRIAKLAPERYTVKTPEGPKNKAFFRDNLADVLEELADAYNIVGLMMQRCEEMDEIPTRNAILALQNYIASVGISTITLRDFLRSSAERMTDTQLHLLVEDNPLGILGPRDVPLSEVGL